MRSNLVRERLRRFAAGHREKPLGIVSYDVASANNAVAVAIAHFIFGHSVRARVNGGTKEYRYPGFIEKEGVVWLGQSVFLLTLQRSRELQDFLASKGAAYEVLSVRVG
ncbi:MAG: hypothetical protein A3K65_05270 [Euryarchaeota archaeon RBG_16_68_12]|nr:MAG: hypothetical protein A3K65_05270 [Euryarchaeota archaeon RBG_16_68_12]